MTAKNIRLDEVKKLAVQPGEVLVIKCKKPLPPAETEAIARWFSRNLPGVSFLFMDETIDLTVLKKSKRK